MIPPVYKLSDAKEERRRSIQNEKDKETELYLRSATPSMPIKSEIRRFPGFGLTRFIPAVANMNGRALETYKVQTEQQNIMNELFKQKETSKSGKNNTVDVTVSVMDIDYIDPVDGSFFCAFHTTCMYQFIVESQKRFKEMDYDFDVLMPDSQAKMKARAADPNYEFLLNDDSVLEEAMRDVGYQYRNKLATNVFYKLFWEKIDSHARIHKHQSAEGIAKRLRSTEYYTMASGEKKFYRSYTLNAEEARVFAKYYTLPVLRISNVKQKVAGEEINWLKSVRIILYEEVVGTGAHDNGEEHGKVYVMVKQRFDYFMKELFELRTFPFDYQDLSIELELDGAEGFDMVINDVRFRKAALVDQEWVMLIPNVRWYNPVYSEITLRARRRPTYYLLNVVLVMFLLCSLGLTGYSMDIEDLGNRLNIQVTLVLTIVAFKYVLASFVPRTPYNTQLDIYMFLCTFTVGFNALGVIAGDQVSKYYDYEYGQRVDSAVFYCFAVWTLFFTISWFMISYLRNVFTSGVVTAREIIFDELKDSDEMYDFEVKYYEDYSYGVNPVFKQHVKDILTEASNVSQPSISDDMIDVLFQVPDEMITLGLPYFLKHLLDQIDSSNVKSNYTPRESMNYRQAKYIYALWVRVVERKTFTEYFQIGHVEARAAPVVPKSDLSMDALEIEKETTRRNYAISQKTLLTQSS